MPLGKRKRLSSDFRAAFFDGSEKLPADFETCRFQIVNENCAQTDNAVAARQTDLIVEKRDDDARPNDLFRCFEQFDVSVLINSFDSLASDLLLLCVCYYHAALLTI